MLKRSLMSAALLMLITSAAMAADPDPNFPPTVSISTSKDKDKNIIVVITATRMEGFDSLHFGSINGNPPLPPLPPITPIDQQPKGMTWVMGLGQKGETTVFSVTDGHDNIVDKELQWKLTYDANKFVFAKGGFDFFADIKKPGGEIWSIHKTINFTGDDGGFGAGKWSIMPIPEPAEWIMFLCALPIAAWAQFRKKTSLRASLQPVNQGAG